MKKVNSASPDSVTSSGGHVAGVVGVLRVRRVEVGAGGHEVAGVLRVVRGRAVGLALTHGVDVEAVEAGVHAGEHGADLDAAVPLVELDRAELRAVGGVQGSGQARCRGIPVILVAAGVGGVGPVGALGVGGGGDRLGGVVGGVGGAGAGGGQAQGGEGGHGGAADSTVSHEVLLWCREVCAPRYI